ncbi:MAG: hypothetical protein CVU55_02790 [Deltaproteobacteria bacterium HGW-Deltaproteobacteria-13]|jgi:PAS domain S-box-containing protein/putative nucleotidyltransferase with HDIG domain|nr:MAG: hypothetical protein CVU55_02790 [Deltaproteobacteria bacterium HGW-Deltaproteobacteria-13]
MKNKTTSVSKKQVKVVKKKTTSPKKHLSSKKMKDEKKPQTKSGLKISAALKKRTAKKQNSENVKKYQNIIKNIHDGYFELDLAGNFTVFNDSVCRVLGYSRRELMGMNYRCYTDKENVNRVFQVYNKVYKTGKPFKAFGWQVTRKDGSERYIEESISLLKNSSGKATGFLGIVNDITEKRKAEQDYQTLFREMLDGFSLHEIIRDTQGQPVDYRFLTVNPAFERMTGLKAERIIGRTVLEVLPGTEQRWIETYGRVVITGEPAFFEDYSGTLDKYFQVTAFRSSSNLFACIFADITERKRVEDELRKSEKYFKELTENSSDIIIITDENGNIKYCSRSVERFLGYKPEEMIGESAYSFIHPDEIKRAVDDFSKAILAKDTMIIPNGFRVLHKNGSEIYLDGIGKNLLDNPDIAGFVMNVRDITERKLAEEKYRNIFENAQEGIYQSTPEGRFIMANHSMARILGYDSPEELITSITDIASQVYVDPEERTKFIETIEQQGFVRKYEVRFYRKDGRIIWVSRATRVVRDKKGEILYHEGIIEDTTDRKESIDRLRNALGGTIRAIASMVETRDPYTAGHQRRVSDLARAIATEMGLSNDRVEGLRVAAIIHDIGKLSIPAEILSKSSKLTNIEFNLIKYHSQSGYDILKDIEFPWPIARMVIEHHERMDGSGYPNGITGDNLLLESRILSVADVVEAMVSHRPYRPALGPNKALEEIVRNKGTLYDPDVVNICLRLFNEKGYRITE